MGRRSGRARHRSRVARTVASVKTRDRAVTRTWPSPARGIWIQPETAHSPGHTGPHIEPRGTKRPRPLPCPGLLQSPLVPRGQAPFPISIEEPYQGAHRPDRPIQFFQPALLSSLFSLFPATDPRPRESARTRPGSTNESGPVAQPGVSTTTAEPAYYNQGYESSDPRPRPSDKALRQTWPDSSFDRRKPVTAPSATAFLPLPNAQRAQNRQSPAVSREGEI